MAPPLELQAKTPAGARLVRYAESLAKQLSLPVAQHERDGIYSQDNARLLKEAGYFVAPIPAQFGGLDVTSVHDILVASTRLARGDPSTTLGLNMHLLIVLNIVRRWRLACLHADERRAAAFGRSLERMVEEGVVLAAAISEPNQHLTQPAAHATRNGARMDREWPQDLLHHVAGSDAFCRVGHVPEPRGHIAIWVCRDSRGRAWHHHPRRLGRAGDAHVRQQLGQFP